MWVHTTVKATIAGLIFFLPIVGHVNAHRNRGNWFRFQNSCVFTQCANPSQADVFINFLPMVVSNNSSPIRLVNAVLISAKSSYLENFTLKL